MKATSWIVVLTLLFPTGEQALDRLPADAASVAVGRVVTVCGEVIALGCLGPDPAAALTFLTPSAGTPVSVTTQALDGASLGIMPGDRLQPRRACVTAPVERAKDGLRLAVHRREQVVFDPPPSRPPPAAARVRRSCDPGVRMPIMLRAPRPQYSADAMRRKLTGTVVLQAVVGTAGTAQHVQVLRSLDPDLDEAAVRAVQKASWTPGWFDGAPADILVTFEMAFTLGPQR